jgi:hypothetical protein
MTNTLILNGIIVILLLVLSPDQLKGQTVTSDTISVKGRNIKILDSCLVASPNASSGVFSIGRDWLTGNLGDHFSLNFVLGLGGEYLRKKEVFQFEGFLGIGEAEQTFSIPGKGFVNNFQTVGSFSLGANYGYQLINSKNIRLVPLTGLGITWLNFSASQDKEHSPVTKVNLPYVKFGAYIDFKSLSFIGNHVRINRQDYTYASLRLSAGMNAPIGKPKFPEYYYGALFYFSVGMSVMNRDYYLK